MRSAKKRLFVLFSIVFVALVAFGVWGCAPQTSAPSTDSNVSDQDSGNASDGQYADDFTWTVDSDCAVCHTIESDAATNPAVLSGFHTATEGMTCATCHIDTAGLEQAHEGKNATSKEPKRLRKTKIEESFCLSCHDDYPTLAKQTASYTELVDKNGLIVNPHDLAKTSDHRIITCTSCHVMHKDETPIESTKEQCLSCHHENVFECNTCH